MQTIEHHGFKAYIIDSEELIRLDMNSAYRKAIQEALSKARSQGYGYVLVITSLPYLTLPKWLRRYIDMGDKIRCYRGKFP